MPNIHTNISFGLVNIPVVMNPIIKNNDTSFNQLHKKCMHRIKYFKYCPTCKCDVKEKDLIKGYEYENNKYVVFTKDDLNNLKSENEKEIEVLSFIDINEIDPSYFEKSYFLNTDTKSKSYTLFYRALKKTKKVALCRTIIGSKFYYSILRLNENGIIMTTLYFEEEVNMSEANINKSVTDKELNLAIQLIDSMKAKFEPEKYVDIYQDKIKDAIDDKLAGKKITKSKKKEKVKINDLMEALEKSIKKK